MKQNTLRFRELQIIQRLLRLEVLLQAIKTNFGEHDDICLDEIVYAK